MLDKARAFFGRRFADVCCNCESTPDRITIAPTS
jgi:hypothetical protein